MPQKIRSLEFHSRQSLDYMPTSSNAYYTAFQGVATPQNSNCFADLLSSVSRKVATPAHASKQHDTPALFFKL